jgi:antitoxin (DNA-binding transcriptional repressor) of toxin-antitoxin stability system
MTVTASQLRQDIYRLLDQVLESGEPLEIVRKGRRLRLIPDSPARRLDRIVGNSEAIIGDPDELVSIDWSREWTAGASES